MDEKTIEVKFLKVGYARRNDNRELSDTKGRQVMGRKGIGKLAMFSLAEEIQVFTKCSEKEGVAFVVNVSELQHKIRQGEDYQLQRLPFDKSIMPHDSGTAIIMNKLNRNVNRTPTYLRRRLARRFSVIGDDFQININDKPITIADRDFLSKAQFLWSIDENEERILACSNLDQQSQLDDKIYDTEGNEHLLKGYIASVREPTQLKDDEISNNTITIMANGRIFHENILDQIDNAKHFNSYLVGEIEADFLDSNQGDDMATTSRQYLQENDPRFKLIKNYVAEQLKTIDKQWSEWRGEGYLKQTLENYPRVQDWIHSLPRKDEQKAAQKLIKTLGKVKIEDDETEQKKELLRNTILAFEKLRIKNNLELIEDLENNPDALRNVFISIEDVEASLYHDISRQRLAAITKLSSLASKDENTKEKIIQEHLFKHLWLIDPSWDRIAATAEMEKTVTQELKKACPDTKTGARIDITYATISGKHVIIELKRPTKKVKLEELQQQGRKYVLAIREYYKQHPASIPSDPQIEVIFVLGRDIDRSDQSYVEPILSAINAKVYTYNDLILKAKLAYMEYINHQPEMERLQSIIDSITEF